MRAAIYHYIQHKYNQPQQYQALIQHFVLFSRYKGCTEYEIFFDKSERLTERPEFDRLFNSLDQFDILIVKNYSHMLRATGSTINIIKKLHTLGIPVYSLEEAPLNYSEAPFEKPLNIASYYCCQVHKENMRDIIPVQNSILALFTQKETKWTVIDQYFDESERQRHGEQPFLSKLIANKERYDLIIVPQFADLHHDISTFCNIRKHLKLDIYSLKEGFIKYDEEVIL